MGLSIKDEMEDKYILKTDKINYLSLKSPNDEYEYVEINEKKYIVIKNENNLIETWDDYSNIEKTNDLNLTNSILKLKEEMPYSKFYEILDKGFIQDDTILYKIENELNNDHIEKIIEWCKSYGLPFLGEWGFVKSNKKDYKWFGFTNDMKTCFENNIYGFRIGTFLIGINIIYKTAHCADALRKIRTGKISSKEIETSNIRIEKINTDGDKYYENTPNKQIELYENCLEDYINKTTKAAQYHFQLGTKSNKVMYVPKLYAETLLSASMYILFLWCCSPYNYTLKRCGACNSFFVTQDPREVYCKNPCTRHTSSKANSRNSKQVK